MDGVLTTSGALVRVRPSAMRGRAFRLGVSSALAGFTSFGVAFFSDLHPALRIACAAISFLYLWSWCRYPVTGVWTTPEKLVIRGWWRTRSWPRHDIAIVRAESYLGYLFVVGLHVTAGILEHGVLVMEMKDGSRVRLGGTVSDLWTARRTAEAVNAWLGLEAGAGLGERRRARLARREEPDMPGGASD